MQALKNLSDSRDSIINPATDAAVLVKQLERPKTRGNDMKTPFFCPSNFRSIVRFSPNNLISEIFNLSTAVIRNYSGKGSVGSIQSLGYSFRWRLVAKDKEMSKSETRVRPSLETCLFDHHYQFFS